ncbi:MAG: hypothetical protein BWY28_01069 [bacterium ADurb.Bin236]|nr:MAG: hypothetical protein BWY28_01069 [bacterium ADurb.Bin236]
MSRPAPRAIPEPRRAGIAPAMLIVTEKLFKSESAGAI